MKYVLCVRSGNGLSYYYINERMEITQSERYRTMGDTAFSSQWRLVCFYEELPFGNRRTLDISDFNSVPTKYKNGKGRLFVGDIDHGTHRVWATQRVESFYPVKSFL